MASGKRGGTEACVRKFREGDAWSQGQRLVSQAHVTSQKCPPSQPRFICSLLSLSSPLSHDLCVRSIGLLFPLPFVFYDWPGLLLPRVSLTLPPSTKVFPLFCLPLRGGGDFCNGEQQQQMPPVVVVRAQSLWTRLSLLTWAHT